MFRLFRSRPLGRMVAVIVLLCAVLALQPATHAHAQPAAAGHHGGHNGHNHGSGDTAGQDQNHGAAALPDSCCHVATNGCSAVAFLPATSSAVTVVWQRGALHRPNAKAGLAGLTTAPDHRPPKRSS